jgi:hypothetical protein
MRRKITFTALLLLILVSTTWISIDFYKYALISTRDYVVQNLKLITQNTSDKVKYFLLDYRDSIKVVSERIAYKDLPLSSIKTLFQDELKHKNYLSYIYLIDKNNNLVLSSPANSKKDFFKNKKFLTTHLNKSRALSSCTMAYYGSQKQNFSTFYIFSPIVDKQTFKSSGNIICASIDMFSLEHLIQPVAFEGSLGQTWISNEENLIITAPKSKQADDYNLALTASTLDNQHKNTPTQEHFSYSYKNKKFIIVSSPLIVDNFKWKLTVHLPDKAITELIFPFYIKILTLLSFVFIIIIGVIFIFIKNENIIQKLRHRIATLEIYIDEEQKTKDVKDIVESDYFTKLANKAGKIKKTLK